MIFGANSPIFSLLEGLPGHLEVVASLGLGEAVEAQQTGVQALHVIPDLGHPKKHILGMGTPIGTPSPDRDPPKTDPSLGRTHNHPSVVRGLLKAPNPWETPKKGSQVGTSPILGAPKRGLKLGTLPEDPKYGVLGFLRRVLGFPMGILGFLRGFGDFLGGFWGSPGGFWGPPLTGP